MRHLALTLCAIIGAQSASAQTCIGSAELYAILTDKFGESRHFSGLAANGMLVETWTNETTGTWTTMVTQANGLSCPIATGEAFVVMPGPVAGVPG